MRNDGLAMSGRGGLVTKQHLVFVRTKQTGSRTVFQGSKPDGFVPRVLKLPRGYQQRAGAEEPDLQGEFGEVREVCDVHV